MFLQNYQRGIKVSNFDMLIAVHPFKNTKPLAKLNLDYHMCHFTQHFQQSDFWPTKQTLQLKHALYSPDLASCNYLFLKLHSILMITF